MTQAVTQATASSESPGTTSTARSTARTTEAQPSATATRASQGEWRPGRAALPTHTSSWCRTWAIDGDCFPEKAQWSPRTGQRARDEDRGSEEEGAEAEGPHRPGTRKRSRRGHGQDSQPGDRGPTAAERLQPKGGPESVHRRSFQLKTRRTRHSMALMDTPITQQRSRGED